MKESIDATIAESSRLEQHDDEWKLINGQVSIDELIKDEEE